MDAQKLGRANHIYKTLLPNIETLEDPSKSSKIKIGCAFYCMVEEDEAFANAIRKVLAETKERLTKEFNEL